MLARPESIEARHKSYGPSFLLHKNWLSIASVAELRVKFTPIRAQDNSPVQVQGAFRNTYLTKFFDM